MATVRGENDRAAKRWWAIVVDGEVPDVYGPYRSYETAANIANKWNDRPGVDIDDLASVQPMKSGPIKA